MAAVRKTITAVVGVVMLGTAATLIYREQRQPPEDPEVLRLRQPGRAVAVAAVSTLEPTVQRADAEDAAVEQAMRSTDRYVRVPAPGGMAAESDASGRVWFNSFFGDAAMLRRSVERAAHGQGRVIRGGRILLADDRGCYWAVDHNASELLCYDGKTWLPPHAAAPATPEAGSAGAVEFFKVALQTTAGDRFFLTGGRSAPAVLHRYSAAGVWTQSPLPDNAILPASALLAEQSEGRVAIYAVGSSPQGNGTSLAKGMAIRAFNERVGMLSGAKVAAYVWSERSFVAVEPVAGSGVQAPLNQAVPLPDGSIMTVYQGSDQVTPAWPADRIAPRDERVMRRVKELDDPDPRVREAAVTELLKLGPSARAAVDAALADPANAGPQRQDSLQAVAERLRAAADPNLPPAETLFGGRYQLRGVVQTSRSVDGSVRLFVQEANDVQAGVKYGRSFVTIDRQGRWRINAVPDRPDLISLTRAVQSAFEDTRGLLWIDGWFGQNDKRVLDPADFAVRPALPIGLDAERITASDRAGRVYFRTHFDECLVINPNASESRPQLTLSREMPGNLSRGPDDRTAFVMDTVPSMIGPDGVLRSIPAPHDLPCRALMPLRGGAAFVTTPALGSNEPDGGYRFLWDGQAYHDAPGGTFGRQVAVQHAVLRALAPPRFADGAAGRRTLQVVSDRQQGLWCTGLTESDDARPDATRPHASPVYHDGAEWHDTWPLFQNDRAPTDAQERVLPGNVRQPLELLGVADDGHTLLVWSKPLAEVFAVVFEGGKLQRRSVAAAVNTPPSDQIISPRGRSWFSTTYRRDQAGQLYVYQDGRLQSLAWPGKPVFADAADRLWCVMGKTLNVVDAGETGGLSVPDLDHTARVNQSPDGRLWLLHRAGLDEVSVVDGKPRLGRRWAWNGPLNAFDGVIDSRNGLWLGGNGGRVGRFELPQR